MRILHVTPTYVPAWRYGGPIRSVHGLAAAQAEAGHDVTVYTSSLDGPRDLDLPVADPVIRDGVSVLYFAVPRWLGPLGRRLVIAPGLDRALRQSVAHFDIVHCHSTFLWPTTAAARAARKAGRPYVLSPRGMLWPEMIAQRSSLLKRAWIRLFERENVESAAAIHVTAMLEAAKVEELGLRVRRFIDLPNGIDGPGGWATTDLSPDVADAVTTPSYVLTLGRISWKKNNEALIDALRDRPSLHVVVAGNDDEGHATSLVRRAEGAGVAERVTVIARHVDGADKEALFANAAIFALPSHSENFGNSVIEAMIRGVPVLASHSTGAAEVVRRADAGRICGTDAASVGAALDAFMADPAQTSAMGERGAIHAREHFGWPDIAAAMVEQYRGLLR